MKTQRQVVLIEANEVLTAKDKGALTRLLKTSTVAKAFAVVGAGAAAMSVMAYMDAKGLMAKVVDAGNSKKVADLAEALITFDVHGVTYEWAKKNGLPCYVRKGA